MAPFPLQAESISVKPVGLSLHSAARALESFSEELSDLAMLLAVLTHQASEAKALGYAMDKALPAMSARMEALAASAALSSDQFSDAHNLALQTVQVPTGLDGIKAVDADFWLLHAAWRQLKDECAASPCQADDPEGQVRLERASKARGSMFLSPVRSASALLAKLVACDEGSPGSVVDELLLPAITVFEAIKNDCERVSQREAQLADHHFGRRQSKLSS